MKTDTRAEDIAVAEDYYDSDDADRFYFNIWGGEDIHIGLYESSDEAIATASRRTVETMTKMMGPAMKVKKRPVHHQRPCSRSCRRTCNRR